MTAQPIAVADLPGTLDRIVLAGTDTGVHVLGSSLTSSELAGWTALLQAHIAVDRQDRPATSLWYYTDGGAVALLRRIRGQGGGREAGQDGGREAGQDGGQDGDPASDPASGDRCHALVGWYQDLPPDLALRMHGWVGWAGPAWTGPELRRLDMACSRSQYARPYDLDRGAVEQLPDLIALVAAVLRCPQRPVSVASEPSSLIRRIALLWGLRAVVSDLFDIVGEGPFTFSTFEARHATGGSVAPRVAFVPSDVPDAFPARCYAVRLPVPDAGRDDAYSYAARELVSCYVNDGTPGVLRWLDQRQVRASHSVVDRVQRVVDTADASVPLASAPLRPVARRQPARQRPARRRPAQRSTDSPADSTRTGPAGTVLALTDLDLARLGAADPDTVRRVARLLSVRRLPGSAARRAEARELLVRDRSWEQRMRVALPPDQARAVVDGLVRFAFQPTDLRDDDVVCHIRLLVATLDTSSIMLGSLVALLIEHGEYGLLTEITGQRWLREHGYPVAGPDLTPSTRSREQRA
jgi:hypothetical protein